MISCTSGCTGTERIIISIRIRCADTAIKLRYLQCAGTTGCKRTNDTRNLTHADNAAVQDTRILTGHTGLVYRNHHLRHQTPECQHDVCLASGGEIVSIHGLLRTHRHSPRTQVGIRDGQRIHISIRGRFSGSINRHVIHHITHVHERIHGVILITRPDPHGVKVQSSHTSTGGKITGGSLLVCALPTTVLAKNQDKDGTDTRLEISVRNDALRVVYHYRGTDTERKGRLPRLKGNRRTGLLLDGTVLPLARHSEKEYRQKTDNGKKAIFQYYSHIC